jgi:hypothetical protein
VRVDPPKGLAHLLLWQTGDLPKSRFFNRASSRDTDEVQTIHSRSKTLDITFGGVTCNTLKMVEESFGVVGVFFWL